MLHKILSFFSNVILIVHSQFFPSDPSIQEQAIDCITDLIACHDSDTRYDEPSCRARVASLYLPLLGIVIEYLPLLHGAPMDDENGSLNLSVANAIATSSLTSRWMPNNDEVRSDFSSQVCYDYRRPKIIMIHPKQGISFCFTYS